MLYVGIIAGIIALEYVIKNRMDKDLRYGEKDILNGHVRLNLYHNKGIALNFLERHVTIVKIVTGTMIGMLLFALGYMMGAKKSKLYGIGLSLILGGAISNYLDRKKKGYVVDYFSFEKVKRLRHIVFNLADFAIFIGSILVIIAEVITGHNK